MNNDKKMLEVQIKNAVTSADTKTNSVRDKLKQSMEDMETNKKNIMDELSSRPTNDKIEETIRKIVT